MMLIPHHANQFRPHLIRRVGLFVVVVLAVGAQLTSSIGGTALGMQKELSAADLLRTSNEERRSHGEAPLQLDEKLSRAAQLKVQDMFKQQYWAHDAPDGTSPWHWFKAAGYSYSYAGENLAKDFTSARAVTSAWMASPDHRANILDNQYAQVGFAVMEGTLSGKATTLVVALYGAPVSAIAATTTKAPAIAAVEGRTMSLWTRFVIALQSVTPAVLVCLMALTIAAIVAAFAQLYRSRLPKRLRQTHYRYHGIYKAAGLVSLIITIISLYGSGQI